MVETTILKIWVNQKFLNEIDFSSFLLFSEQQKVNKNGGRVKVDFFKVDTRF
jgi:hypothetical protein